MEAFEKGFQHFRKAATLAFYIEIHKCETNRNKNPQGRRMARRIITLF